MGGWATCTALIPCSRFGHKAWEYVNTGADKLLYRRSNECLELTATGLCGCDGISGLKRHHHSGGKQVHQQVLKNYHCPPEVPCLLIKETPVL